VDAPGGNPRNSGEVAVDVGIPLSVLDLSPVPSGTAPSQALHETVELARVAERLGYERFWLAEHHNVASVVSSAPAVMIATVAAATTRIRVGSGGIMLPNHSPLAVAETFRVLGGLHPGRIDLGLGRAPGTDRLTALALRRSREAVSADDFPQQYAELLAYVDGFPPDHPFAPITAVPADVELPPVWILGSSLYGAQAAAAFGTGFAFAGHFGSADPAEAITAYRSRFTPSTRRSHPRAILAAAAIAAPTRERAEQLALGAQLSTLRLRRGTPGPLPSPEEAQAYPWTDLEREFVNDFRRFVSVGTPEEVRDDLLDRARRADADELMITTNVHDPAERRASYELLAGAFQMVDQSVS
jgi:luciferase family oxidoreductase group 1